MAKTNVAKTVAKVTVAKTVAKTAVAKTAVAKTAAKTAAKVTSAKTAAKVTSTKTAVTKSTSTKSAASKVSVRLAKRVKAEAELKTLRSRRLMKSGETLKHFKTAYANEVTYGKVVIHIQLPTNNVETLISQMDYDKENTCVFKEGFIVNIIKTECNTIWAKPAYLLLTPQEFKICEKAEESTCFSTVPLCQVSHIYTPTDWQSSPCFKVMSKEKDHAGKSIQLAELCATDYPAAMGWQHAILSYHRCSEAQYQHKRL